MQQLFPKPPRKTLPRPLFFLLLFILLTILACGKDYRFEMANTSFSSTESHKKNIPVGGGPSITSSAMNVPSGGTVSLTIVPSPVNESRTITWTPPQQQSHPATNFQFSVEPKHGGPPFVFENVSKDTRIHVTYTAPTIHYEKPTDNEVSLSDSIVETFSDGSKMMAVSFTYITNDASKVATARQDTNSLAVTRAETGTVAAWQLPYIVQPNMITITTEICQDWRDKLLSDDFFFAAQLPMTTTAITGSYRVPFVLDSPYSQTLTLYDFTSGYSPFLTTTLTYRPERIDFLENELPAKSGNHWVALGADVSHSGSQCSDGMNIAPNKWSISADLLLDLHDQPNNCDGCVVQFYYCYEGQDSPLRTIAERTLAHSLDTSVYQDDNITCFGPDPFPIGGKLTMIGGAPGMVITPTIPITLHEYIANSTNNAITLTYTSSVSGWKFYGGNSMAPNLGNPLTLPTQVPSSFTNIWMVNPVPADTPAGSHMLVLTATSVTTPSLFMWDTVSMWSGEVWTAPPEGQKYIYLPLVMK